MALFQDHCDLSDEECGKHSGIPQCCRDWFVNVWRHILYKPFYFELEDDFTIEFVHYIRCPGCRQTGAYIKIKPCPEHLIVQRGDSYVSESV